MRVKGKKAEMSGLWQLMSMFEPSVENHGHPTVNTGAGGAADLLQSCSPVMKGQPQSVTCPQILTKPALLDRWFMVWGED